MRPSERADCKRRDTAVQNMLELIPLFEADAQWGLVESSRALIAMLRSWDFSAAWRLFCALDLTACLADPGLGRARDRILDRFAIVGSLLGSMVSDSEESLATFTAD